jgi:UDP-N-acetyl-2-amino-2-deoxyglucuronate dehydrogenase
MKFAIVGCGRIFKKHSEVFKSKNITGIKLVSVCDVNINKAKLASSQMKVPYYKNMDKMMKFENPDVVVILTESGNHFKHIKRLSKYKKNIIVEKPLALKTSHAKKIIQIAKRNNIKIFVVKQNRFNLPIVKLKEAFDKKRFGKIFMGTVRVRWCREQSYYNHDKWRGTKKYDGGVYANQASHHIDMLLWFLGKVKSVYAKGIKAIADIECHDTVIAILKFKSGAIGSIEATTATRPKDLEGSISILGNKGSVVVGGYAMNKINDWHFAKSKKIDKNIEKFSNSPKTVYGFGHLEFYKNIINHLQFDEKITITLEEGLDTVKVIEAISESINKNKEIYII